MSLTLVASASWMKWNDTENQVHARDIFKSGDEHKWFSELGDEDGADMTWKSLMLNISCETPALSREDQHQRTKKNVPKSVAHVRPLLCASYSLRVHSFFSPRKSISLHHNVLSLTTREHTKYIRSWKKEGREGDANVHFPENSFSQFLGLECVRCVGIFRSD